MDIFRNINCPAIHRMAALQRITCQVIKWSLGEWCTCRTSEIFSTLQIMKCHSEHYTLCWAKSASCTEHPHIVYIRFLYLSKTRRNCSDAKRWKDSFKIWEIGVQSVRIPASFKQRHLKILALNSLDVVWGLRKLLSKAQVELPDPLQNNFQLLSWRQDGHPAPRKTKGYGFMTVLTGVVKTEAI